MHMKKDSSSYRYTGMYSNLAIIISERNLEIKPEMFQSKHQGRAHELSELEAEWYKLLRKEQRTKQEK